MNDIRTRRKFFYVGVGLILLPVVLVLIYALYANISRQVRFDGRYFSPQYRDKYDVPAKVTAVLEQALQNGDEALYAELTGLKRSPRELQPQPNLYFSILLDVDDAGYFHYLFFNFDNYHRSIYYLKEVKGRWVVVPTDLYFYWDSNQWWNFMLPPALAYWALLLVLGAGYMVNLKATSYRLKTFGGR